MPERVTIIIVNWNGRQLLEQCIGSILECPPSGDFDVIVVDNDSSDGSQAWLHEKRRDLGDRLKLILNDENVGFGRANNQAMRASGADYFFLLNSDAVLKPGSIDALIDEAESDPRIGVVGPRLVDESGAVEPSVWRNPPSAWEILVTGFRIYRLLPRRIRGELLLGQFWPHASRRDVTFIHGAAMLIRRKVFDEVGGFDEDFFMYGEDMEYSLRIAHAGWRLVFTPRAEIIHKRSKSSIQKWGDDEKTRVQVRGYLQFYNKSLNRRRLLSVLSANVAVMKLEGWLRKLRKLERRDLDLRLDLYEEEFRHAWGDLVGSRAADSKTGQ